MKKKILALILAAALVLTTLPVFADTQSLGPIPVTNKDIETVDNPLVVSGGIDGIKYVCMGDSVAFGYGLNDPKEINEHKAFDTIDGSYPTLIKAYLKDSWKLCSFFQGAVCGTRTLDDCYFLDPENFSRDEYHLEYYKTSYFSEEEFKTYTDYIYQLQAAVRDADFITITNGGNDTLLNMLLSTSWKLNVDKTNMEHFFGKTAVASYTALKDGARKLVGNNDEAEKTLESVFDLLDIMLYSMGCYAKGQAELLDIIHKINPDVEMAITGLPGIFKGYTLRVSDDVVINLSEVFNPMSKILNNFAKNAAEERSSYVRYIDISDVETISPPSLEGKTDITAEEFIGIPSAQLIAMIHPSYNGHNVIAERILSNFEFKIFGEKLSNMKNKMNNIIPTIKSRIGITKVENLINSLKNFDLMTFLKENIKFIKNFASILKL